MLCGFIQGDIFGKSLLSVANNRSWLPYGIWESTLATLKTSMSTFTTHVDLGTLGHVSRLLVALFAQMVNVEYD